MSKKLPITLALILLVASTALFAAYTVDGLTATFGIVPAPQMAVYAQQDPYQAVSTHHQIDIPASFPTSRTQTGPYALLIRDTNADLIPDSNYMVSAIYELSDVKITIDPDAFETKPSLLTASSGTIGLIIDIMQGDANQGNLVMRDRLTWRASGAFFSHQVSGLHYADACDFEHDPIVIEKSYETPLIFTEDPSGEEVRPCVWFRVTFFNVAGAAGNHVCHWNSIEDGITATFSGRYITF